MHEACRVKLVFSVLNTVKASSLPHCFLMFAFAVQSEQAALPVYAEKVNFELNASCASVPGHTLRKDCIVKLQEVDTVQIDVSTLLRNMGLIYFFLCVCLSAVCAEQR